MQTWFQDGELRFWLIIKGLAERAQGALSLRDRRLEQSRLGTICTVISARGGDWVSAWWGRFAKAVIVDGPERFTSLVF